MTYIYLIRHCEAMGNKQRLFQGSTDCDISDTGAKQLEYLAERFMNIDLDAVFSSPLIRTQKTAHAIAAPKGMPVNIRQNLIELHGGIVEGKPFEVAFNSIAGLADIWNNRPQDFAPQGGEPMKSAYERIYNEILNLSHENNDKTIAVATHGGVLRCLICRILYNDISRLKDVPWCENTSVTLLRVDESGKIGIEFFNDYSHVPKQYMPKRNRIVRKA